MSLKDENAGTVKPKINYDENTVKAAFITSIAGLSALISFAYAYGATKKKDMSTLDNISIQTYESGSQLAFRALKYGTFYAFTSVGLICYGIWKLSKANNMVEFKEKMGSLFPKVPKNSPEGRTEFDSLTDLMQYLNDEYSTPKNKDGDKKSET